MEYLSFLALGSVFIFLLFLPLYLLGQCTLGALIYHFLAKNSSTVVQSSFGSAVKIWLIFGPPYFLSFFPIVGIYTFDTSGLFYLYGTIWSIFVVCSLIYISMRVWKCSLVTAIRSNLIYLVLCQITFYFTFKDIAVIFENFELFWLTESLLLALLGIYAFTADEGPADVYRPPFWLRYNVEPFLVTMFWLFFVLGSLCLVMVLFTILGIDPLLIFS